MDISPKRQLILEFIRDFLDEHGYPPSVRDIQSGCEISSTSVVDHHLRALEREGHLKRNLKVSRGLELVGQPKRNLVTVPIIGYVPAGGPMPVPDADAWTAMPLGDVLELPTELVSGRRDVYALRVKGTSMVDALIGDGDIVLMRQANEANDGDMVAVWLKGDKAVTLKKIYREGPRMRLQPANSTMDPIIVDAADVEVQGKVVGVLRTY